MVLTGDALVPAIGNKHTEKGAYRSVQPNNQLRPHAGRKT